MTTISFRLRAAILFVPTQWQIINSNENKLLKSSLPVVTLETNGRQSPGTSSY